MKKIALVLAGGKGERIGGNKPFKYLKGKPLIFWALKPYLELNLPIWISLRDSAQKKEIITLLSSLSLPIKDFDFLLDSPLYKGMGPISGLYSAMVKASKDTIFIVSAVDQPFILKEAVEYLLFLGEIFLNFSIVFIKEDAPEPFPGVYPSSLLHELKEFLEKNKSKSMKGFLHFLLKKNLLVFSDFWHKIDFKGYLFYNINTIEELKEAEACFFQEKI
ncbi:MAG: molybdenum cofactor guanylyltransferase [Caldimicrobium sp.]